MTRVPYRPGRANISSWARTALTLCLVSLFLVPHHAFSLGLGKINVRSALNQTLSAEIPLLAASAGDLKSLQIRISTQSFDGLSAGGAGVDYTVETRGKRNFINLTSAKPIREPLINFLVEVEWSRGRLLREFGVLLNPPAFASRVQPANNPIAVLPQRLEAPPQRRQIPAQGVTATAAPLRATTPAAPAAPQPEPVAEAPPKPATEAKPVDATVDDGSPSYLVRRGDTLWRIAERVRPNADVSVQKMMQALLQSNPQAFVRNNIDALKAGATLTIPTIEGLAPAPVAETRVAEAKEPAPVAEPAVTETAPAPTVATTEPVTAEAAPQAVAEAKPEVRLMPPETQVSAAGGSGEASAALAQVRPQLRVASFEELQSRIDQLADSSSEALMATANAAAQTQPAAPAQPAEGAAEVAAGQVALTTAIAAATDATAEQAPNGVDAAATADQNQLPATESAQPAGENAAADPESTGSSTVDGTGGEQVGQVTTAGAAEAPSASLPGASGQSGDAAATVQPAAVAGSDQTQDQGSVAAPAADSINLTTSESASNRSAATVESDWVSKLVQLSENPSKILEDPVMLAAVGGPIALLLIGLLWLFARGRSDDEDEAAFEMEPVVPLQRVRSEARDEEVPAAVRTGSIRRRERLGQAAGTKPQRAAANPVERVDLLLAVGNYREAENVARLALADDPNDKTLLSKVLDVHFAANNTGKFEAGAQQLRDVVESENDPLWQHALDMGRKLSPDHALFVGAAAGATAVGVAGALDDDTMTAGEQTLQTDVETTVLRAGTVDDTLVGDSTLAQPAAGALDFDDFNFSSPEVDSVAQGGDHDGSADIDVTQEFSGGLGDAGLEFSLDELETDNVSDAIGRPAAGTVDDAGETTESLAFESGGLDFDFDDLFEEIETTSVPTEDQTLETELQSMAFEFDNTEALDEAPLEALDLGNLELDDGDSLSLGSDETLLDSEDNVETKLELAAAYLDMEDSDGARSLLEEVLQEGDGNQQERARDMLERVG